MTALPNGRTRHLARFIWSFCGATDCCSLGMNAFLPGTPPAPPIKGKPGAAGGRLEGQKGTTAQKTPLGCHALWKYPGKWRQNLLKPAWLYRKTPSRVTPISPRNASFLPRFGVFLPRRCFCDFWPISISLSIFQRREERKSAKTGKQALPRNFGVWQKNNPGIFPKILQFGGLFFKRNPMLVRVCGRLTPFPPFPGLKCLYPAREGSQ